MGCVSSRENSIEEDCVKNAEWALNFYPINATAIDNALRRYSYNGLVSQSQLIHLSELLKFKIYNTGVYTHIQKFYSSIQDKDGNYSLKDLFVIGMLLCKGSATVKAKFLYEFFDTSLSHQLSCDFIKQEVLVRMLTHSSVTLPELVSSNQVSTEHEAKIIKFMSKIGEAADYALEELSVRMCVRGSVVSESTFVEVLADYRGGELLTPTGIRKYMLEMRYENIAKKK